MGGAQISHVSADTRWEGHSETGGSQPVTVGALLGMVALGVCQDSGSPLVLPSFAGSGDAPLLT